MDLKKKKCQEHHSKGEIFPIIYIIISSYPNCCVFLEGTWVTHAGIESPTSSFTDKPFVFYQCMGLSAVYTW